MKIYQSPYTAVSPARVNAMVPLLICNSTNRSLRFLGGQCGTLSCWESLQDRCVPKNLLCTKTLAIAGVLRRDEKRRFMKIQATKALAIADFLGRGVFQKKASQNAWILRHKSAVQCSHRDNVCYCAAKRLVGNTTVKYSQVKYVVGVLFCVS